MIFERLSSDNRYKDVTLKHLEEFATLGLRTLCIAVADISDDFYDEWKHSYYKASVSMQGREQKLAEAAELIERVRCFGLDLVVCLDGLWLQVLG